MKIWTKAISMNEIVDQDGRVFKEKTKAYEVHLTNSEMQHIANGLAAFMNVMHQRQVTIKPEQTMALLSAMDKFKAALASNKYKVVEL